MSRLFLAVTILGMVAGGLQVDSLPSTRSWVPERFSDAEGTPSEGQLANAAKSDLTTERENLDKELCEARKGPSAPTLVTEMKSEAPKEGGKPVVTVQKTEKLPGNKTKEVVVTEETEKLPSNATVKKTVERQVVKDEAKGNETVIDKKTQTETSTSNATVTEIVKEHKVIKGEAGEEEAEEVKEETVTEEKEVEKAEQTEKEVETPEKPEPAKLPVNATVKKTSVEHKVVNDSSKDGEPQKEIVIEKTTRTDTTKATETPTVGLVDVSVLEEKDGPMEIAVTEKKIEKFTDNETKEVVVEEKVEKLPSNDTIKKAVVELKVTKDTGKDSDRPQQETIIQKEVAVQITNKTAELKAAEKDKKQEYKEKIENIKRQVEEVKEEIKDEEIKTDKLAGAPEACVESETESTKDLAEEKKVEKVAPVLKVLEKPPTVAIPEKVEKEHVAPVVKVKKVPEVVKVGKVIEKPTPSLPTVVVTEEKAPKKEVVTAVPEEKKVVPSGVPLEKVVTVVKDGKVIEKRISVSEE